MNILLNENYKITSDAYNITLNKKTEKKEGSKSTEDNFRPIAFYPSLEQACVGILQKEIHLSDDTINSLESLVKLIKDTEANIVTNVQKLKEES